MSDDQNQPPQFNFDLRALREKLLKLTQKELAEAMDCGQELISRLEQHPEAMSLEFFYKLCMIYRLTPNDVLQFQLLRPKPLVAGDVYAKDRTRILKLRREVRKIFSPADKLGDLPFVEEMENFTERLLDKPLVALLGPSDAGKSSLINALTGLNVLEEKWTPTTSATVHLRHINDKPEWMDEHPVAIFKAESAEQSWNVKNVNQAAYCQKHLLHLGSFDLLYKYCNRHQNRTYEEVDSAIIYTDSDLLLACDFVDLPGFGTENETDTIKSQRTKSLADVVLFLTPALGFLNRHEDMLLLKEIIRTIPAVDTKEAPLLSSLFVLATQARTAKTEEAADEILATRSDALLNLLSEELIESQFGLTKREFGSKLKKRFFSYELDDPALRQKFEASFTKLITKQLPALKRKQTREALATFKNRVISHQTNEIQKVSGVLHSREQAIEGYDKAMQQKEKRFREIDLLQEDLQCKISEAEKQNLAAMTAWEQKTINSDFVMGLIQKKGYDRKQAKNYLLSDLSDLYFAQMQTILKTSLAEFENDLTTFFNAVEQKIEDIDKHAAGVASIPFDFKGALSGGLAGATVLGGLGLWASTVGNLGGYILVAKGVGLLSTLGISVGGGAAATTFVAAIGGPITIAISIALGVFAFVSAIFGDGWKKRMAKDAASAVQKQNVIAHYQKAITTFWQNTQLEIRETVTTIKSTFDQHLSSLESIIKSGDSETARLRLKKLENCLQQFTSLPWNDDEE